MTQKLRIYLDNDVKFKAKLYTSKTYSSGEHPILIRVSRGKEKIYFAVKNDKGIGYKAFPNAWNFDDNRLFKSKPRLTKEIKENLSPIELKAFKEHLKSIKVNPLASKINKDISSIQSKLILLVSKLEKEDRYYSLKELKGIYEESRYKYQESFIDWFNEYLESELDQENKFGTYKTYLTTRNLIQDYLKVKRLNNMPFVAINPQLIKGFIKWLKTKKSKRTNKTFSTSYQNKVLSRFKSVYLKAYKLELKKGNYFPNPFEDLRIKTQKANKGKLSLDEIKKIIEFDCKGNEILFSVKNVFLFAFNTAGMRISDLLELKWSNVIGNFERVEYRAIKTKKIHSIKLFESSIDILKIYHSKDVSQDDFVFPYLNQEYSSLSKKDQLKLRNTKASYINKYLKQLQKELGIKTNISTHIARHSYTHISVINGASAFELKEILGHSSIATTENYISSLNTERLDEALSKTYQAIYEG